METQSASRRCSRKASSADPSRLGAVDAKSCIMAVAATAVRRLDSNHLVSDGLHRRPPLPTPAAMAGDPSPACSVAPETLGHARGAVRPARRSAVRRGTHARWRAGRPQRRRSWAAAHLSSAEQGRRWLIWFGREGPAEGRRGRGWGWGLVRPEAAPSIWIGGEGERMKGDLEREEEVSVVSLQKLPLARNKILATKSNSRIGLPSKVPLDPSERLRWMGSVVRSLGRHFLQPHWLKLSNGSTSTCKLLMWKMSVDEKNYLVIMFW